MDASHGPDDTGRNPDDSDTAYRLEASEDLQPLVHAVCPKCGGTKQTAKGICLRCGEVEAEDTSSAHATSTGDDARATTGSAAGVDGDVAAEEDDDDAERPLAIARSSDEWLPWVVAGAAALALMVGFVVGARGLFPLHTDPQTAVSWWPRLSAVIRLPVFAAAWTVCAFAALMTVAWMEDRPIGVWTVAARRLLAMVLVSQLVTFLWLPWKGVAFAAELIVQLALFAALALLMFRLSMRYALYLTLATVLYGVGAIVLAQFVAWAMGIAV